MGLLVREVQEHQSEFLWEINQSLSWTSSLQQGVAWKQLVTLSSATELTSLNHFVALIYKYIICLSKKEKP